MLFAIFEFLDLRVLSVQLHYFLTWHGGIVELRIIPPKSLIRRILVSCWQAKILYISLTLIHLPFLFYQQHASPTRDIQKRFLRLNP